MQAHRVLDNWPTVERHSKVCAGFPRYFQMYTVQVVSKIFPKVFSRLKARSFPKYFQVYTMQEVLKIFSEVFSSRHYVGFPKGFSGMY